MSNDRYIQANRAHWSERTGVHLGPGGYDLEAFKAGGPALDRVITDEVGDVTGKDLLHLQCHFGLDTLSWARLGATVVGVDFDPVALAAARGLAADIGLPATFVESDVYDAPAALDARFDIVFVSHGALCWLPDIPAWARVAAHFLRPGGFVYVFEFHPFGWSLADESSDGDLRIGYPWFQGREPLHFEDQSDYAVPTATIANPEYTWNHGLGEIITALVDAGLAIDYLHEWPFCASAVVPVLTRGDDGLYRLPGTDAYPLGYSVRATRR